MKLVAGPGVVHEYEGNAPEARLLIDVAQVMD